MPGTKRPVSVLVVIHDSDLNVLLLERAAHPGYWQSVTGSQEGDESLIDTARRELAEETGLPATGLVDWQMTHRFEIFAEWRDRYPADITHNTEHVFSVCVPTGTVPRIAPREHRAWQWLPWEAAAAACFSWSNREAIAMLARKKVDARETAVKFSHH